MSALYPFLHLHRYQAKSTKRGPLDENTLMQKNSEIPSKLQTLIFIKMLSFERNYLFPKLRGFASSIIASGQKR